MPSQDLAALRVLQLTSGGVFGGDGGGSSNGLILFRMEQFTNIEVNDLLCFSWRLQSEVVFFKFQFQVGFFLKVFG